MAATGLNGVCEANGVREAAGAKAELRNSRPWQARSGCQGTAQNIKKIQKIHFELLTQKRISYIF